MVFVNPVATQTEPSSPATSPVGMLGRSTVATTFRLLRSILVRVLSLLPTHRESPLPTIWVGYPFNRTHPVIRLVFGSMMATLLFGASRTDALGGACTPLRVSTTAATAPAAIRAIATIIATSCLPLGMNPSEGAAAPGIAC